METGPIARQIDFDLCAKGAGITGSPANVPVLVHLSLGNFQYFNGVKSDGSDFRFVAGDDKTPLEFHIERFDAQNPLAFLWVHLPLLPGSAWTRSTTDQLLVCPFGATSGQRQDATGYKNEPSAFAAEVTPASLITGAVRLAGAQTISIPARPAADQQGSHPLGARCRARGAASTGSRARRRARAWWRRSSFMAGTRKKEGGNDTC